MSTPVPGVATAQEIDNSAWDDGALVTNPGATTLLKQTSVLTAGIYHIALICWASVDARFKFSRRNAADSADVKSVEIPVPANNSISFTVPTIVDIATGETLKVTNVNAFTGTAQVSIFYAKVGG